MKCGKKFLEFDRSVKNIAIKKGSRLCHTHYMIIYKKYNSRQCKLCMVKSDAVSSWHMAFESYLILEEYCRLKGIQKTVWLCHTCYKNSIRSKSIGKHNGSLADKVRPFVEQAIADIEVEGIIFGQKLFDKYHRKKELESLENFRSFENFFNCTINTSQSSIHIAKYRPTSDAALGTLLYKDSIPVKLVKDTCIYQLTVNNDRNKHELVRLRENKLDIEKLRQLLLDQARAFVKAEKEIQSD